MYTNASPGIEPVRNNTMSHNKEMVKRIQEIFFEKLQEKTSWGRNDLKSMYTEAVNEALLEFV